MDNSKKWNYELKTSPDNEYLSMERVMSNLNLSPGKHILTIQTDKDDSSNDPNTSRPQENVQERDIF